MPSTSRISRSRGPCWRRPAWTMPLSSTPSRRPNFSIMLPGTKGSVNSPEVVVRRIAEEAVAVGVHLQDAAARLDRPRLAVVGELGGRSVIVVVAVVQRLAVRARAIAWIVSVHAASPPQTTLFLLSHKHHLKETKTANYGTQPAQRSAAVQKPRDGTTGGWTTAVLTKNSIPVRATKTIALRTRPYTGTAAKNASGRATNSEGCSPCLRILPTPAPPGIVNPLRLTAGNSGGEA